MLKIKENKKLYSKWRRLQKALKNISSLVKDDGHMTHDHFNNWLKECMRFKTALKETYKETLQHIEKS